MAGIGQPPSGRPAELWRRVVVRPKPMPTNLLKYREVETLGLAESAA